MVEFLQVLKEVLQSAEYAGVSNDVSVNMHVEDRSHSVKLAVVSHAR